MPVDVIQAAPVPGSSGWRELWLKEDWWAIYLGLGLVIVGTLMFEQGSSLTWLAVTPAKWSSLGQLLGDMAANAPRYLAQSAFWLGAFSLALGVLGYRAREFVPGILLLYGLGLAIFAAGQWTEAFRYNLEPPLLALIVGLAIANLGLLPRWFDAGFRVELYVKTGIVLLGATLPLNLMIWAGPIAILQASIVSVLTFLTIFWMARLLKLDRRFAAVLGVGGAVCGVSAAIAVAGAVGARKEDAPIAITIVILWAIVMIFVLPFAGQALHLPAGVGGAWIGTSEFADAAGIAAAEAYGGLAGHGAVAGNADQAVWAFTLMKVVGRDVWIGIWAFVLAVVATLRWDRLDGIGQPDAAQIWWRFPKFVIGFVIASLVVTVVSRDYSLPHYSHDVVPTLVGPLKDLRSWAFIFCFLSIGLTTRFRDLAKAGARPVLAFSAGVAVNVVLGLVLSAVVFAHYWETLSR
ncbi:MAG TPA: putative sulfate exporter family transporter [Lichenihabitans sp.]|jgi:uncharacterized integral membrane protein (TIGR00698 family)|nr:putative sulfate exporter family transporter [Lichenihabitans sp.]